MVSTCDDCGKDFTTNRSARRYCSNACANRRNALVREANKVSGEPVIVWSCGGGVQSSAIAALICKGKLPKPDYAVIVDVGYEKASTFENVREVLQPALAQVGVSLQIIRTTDYRDNDLFDGSGHLIVPGFRRNADGSITKFDTHCSGPWKQKVVMKWLREQGVERAHGWLGISADERRRMHPSPFKWYTWEYPLIKLGMDRVACHIAIYSMGWERVRHTSCYMCPQQDDEQWRYTRHYYPEDWARAVEVEQRVREREPNLYLHRTAQPLEDWIAANPGLGVLSCGGGCEYCA
jgi:hypothetical protein